MGTWSISPTDGGASIDDNGVANIPSNVGGDDFITYKIKYTDDDGCSTTIDYEVPPCTPIECNCSDLSVTPSSTLSKDGGSNIKIGTISMADCMSNPRASSSESWLTNLSVSGSDIKANVSANTGDARDGSVTVTVDKDGGGTCDKSMTVTQSAGGGGPTKRVEIRYTVQFKNIEKGSVDVTLKVPNKNIDINVVAGGGASHSGKTTGIAKFDVDSSWTDEQILAAIDFDLPNMVATLRHEITNYDMRWNGTCLSCDIPDSQCSTFNPWPQICGPCKVCAGVEYGIEIDNIAMTVTGGMCER